MYKIELPKNQLSNLWILKQYAAYPPISQQVVKAVQNWINKAKTEIGCEIEDIQETRERHEREEIEKEIRKEEERGLKPSQ